MAKAMFAAGSFWHAEAAFHRVPGVRRTTVGYSGGHVRNPTFDQVASGQTGHAEVVLIEYDPRRVPYRQLLQVFWGAHDPTERERRGGGLGLQRRSVVFYFTDTQRKAAEESRRQQRAAGVFAGPIVTDVLPAGPFYAAEERHQRYLEKRGLMARSLFGG